jgi:hypothetical protein
VAEEDRDNEAVGGPRATILFRLRCFWGVVVVVAVAMSREKRNANVVVVDGCWPWAMERWRNPPLSQTGDRMSASQTRSC